MSRVVSRVLRRLRLPPGIALMVLSAVLFLAGSASFRLSGARDVAEIGVVGAIAAIAVIVALF